MTLAEFLLARIAEDEAVAQDRTRIGNPPGIRRRTWEAGTRRALAQCAADRRIVDAFEGERQRMDIYNRDYRLGLLTTEGDLRARLSSNARWAGLEIAARALASVHADHESYDENWRP